MDDEQLETVVKALEAIRQAEDELKRSYTTMQMNVE